MMTWFLILYVVLPGPGGDPGINQGYVQPTARAQITMPSQEICEQIRAMNQGAECWARKQ
jgi:hypothetical protein